jgi:hypothetical protein
MLICNLAHIEISEIMNDLKEKSTKVRIYLNYSEEKYLQNKSRFCWVHSSGFDILELIKNDQMLASPTFTVAQPLQTMKLEQSKTFWANERWLLTRHVFTGMKKLDWGEQTIKHVRTQK